MTSTSSNAVTSTTASAGATNTCTSPSLYDIPVNDTACAIPYGGNHTDVMSNCCKSADVVSYQDNCGLYCLVIDQTVSDVTDCLYGDGIAWADAFCNGEGNDTATATAGGGGALATGASVVGGASASKTGGSSSSSSTSSSSSSAAAGVVPVKGFGTAGLAVSGMLLSSVLFGVLQL
ncbi:hypothetical protein Daus18300_000397 [Diaporthe australafricana]|uniref:Extracellular membrane protein CFEM domain-containing protein n=1 Tax=Diaporthe australafricana TaxID=127596 RepID=A0ABR3Y6I7_9PEZI